MNNSNKIGYNRIKTITRLKLSLYIVFGLFLFNQLILMFLPSYLKYSSIESLSFYVQDGWCKNGEGIGKHCFGDFYYIFNFTHLSQPWSNGTMPYPPLTLGIFEIFRIFHSINLSSHFSLILYLLASILAMSFPSIHLFSLKKITLKFSIYLSLIVAISTPMIMSIDRGNIQTLMTPLIYLNLYYFLQRDNKKFIFSGIILVALKPQYILFGILLLARKDMRNFLKWIISTTLFFFTTFLIYPRHLTQNIIDYKNQLEAFNQSAPAGVLYPANLSINGLFGILYRFFTVNSSDEGVLRTIPQLSISVVMLILISSLAVFWINGLKSNQYSVLFIAVSLPLLLTGVSYGYHASSLTIFFLLLGVGILEDLKNNTNFALQFFQSRFIWIFGTALMIVLFIPWSIPINTIPRYKNLFDGNVTFTWILLQVFVSVMVVLNLKQIIASDRRKS
jgi:hypothetical protein